jgi:hypothetical protein
VSYLEADPLPAIGFFERLFLAASVLWLPLSACLIAWMSLLGLAPCGNLCDQAAPLIYLAMALVPAAMVFAIWLIVCLVRGRASNRLLTVVTILDILPLLAVAFLLL